MKYYTHHVYIGEWDRNRKNGIGRFTYAEGHVYEGQWVDDRRQGNRKMSYVLTQY